MNYPVRFGFILRMQAASLDLSRAAAENLKRKLEFREIKTAIVKPSSSDSFFVLTHEDATQFVARSQADQRTLDICKEPAGELIQQLIKGAKANLERIKQEACNALDVVTVEVSDTGQLSISKSKRSELETIILA